MTKRGERERERPINDSDDDDYNQQNKRVNQNDPVVLRPMSRIYVYVSCVCVPAVYLLRFLPPPIIVTIIGLSDVSSEKPFAPPLTVPSPQMSHIVGGTTLLG